MADFLTALLGGPTEAKSSGTWADRAWELVLGGAMSKSGAPITAKTALRISVALSCCRVLAEGIAQIPLKLMRFDAGSMNPAADKSLYRVLYRRPNDWMTSFEFRETLMYHALLCKGGFAVINRIRGEVVELIPVMPDRVRIEQLPDTSLIYHIRLSDGSEAPFARHQIFHLRGPSWDGVQGMEILDLAREALGLAIATEETHARFHKNGAKTAGIISLEGELKEDGRARLKRAFQDTAGGDNSFKTMVLDQGAKYQQMSMNGVDSQHVQVRELQIAEVCRFFRVFPQMAGYSDKTSTFASAEQFFIAHVVHSLGPWVERFEQAADRDLLSEKEIAAGYYTKLSVQALLRGDNASRVAYFTGMYNVGALNPNEIRALEDRNPYPGGEKYRVPLNMADPNAVPPPAKVKSTDESLPDPQAFFIHEGNDMQIKESSATKHLARPFELKELKEDGTFSGYGAVFGNIDLGSDIVAKGAFTRSLKEHKAAGSMPKLLWQHDTCQPIGIYTVMYEDEKGLYVEGQLALKTVQGAEAYELLKMGALGGLSIGYRAKTYEYDTETYVRTLTDVDLWECSLVTFAMNPEATVSAVKGTDLTEREFEQLLTRDAGFSRSQAIVIINGGFKALKTTRDAGLGLHELLGDIKATTEQIANLKKE